MTRSVAEVILFGGLAAVVSILAALWSSLLSEIRPFLPPTMRKSSVEGWAISCWIWDSYIPKKIQRKYFMLHIFGVIFVGYINIFVGLNEDFAATVVFRVVLAGGLVSLAVEGWRHRDRLFGLPSPRRTIPCQSAGDVPEIMSDPGASLPGAPKKMEWYDVLRPREAVAAGLIGLAVAWACFHFATSQGGVFPGYSLLQTKNLGMALMLLGFAIPYWLTRHLLRRR